MEEKKTEVHKLVILVEGKEISLPVDKAKKLYDALGELFKEKVTIKEVHRGEWYPWIYRYEQKYYQDTSKVIPNVVWCSSNQTKFTLENNALRANLE